MQINKETIEQLFRQHYLRMYQLARVLLKDDAASKDVVSEVFADVLDGKTQLGLDNETIASDSPLPSTNAGSYLLVCVRHKCLNLLSRQKMKDRVHHLLKADTSPSIVPLEANEARVRPFIDFIQSAAGQDKTLNIGFIPITNSVQQ